MKIAFKFYPESVLLGNSNGIKSQARIWKNGLRDKKHEVVELNRLENYNWKEFDIVHIFGAGLWLYSFVKVLYL